MTALVETFVATNTEASAFERVSAFRQTTFHRVMLIVSISHNQILEAFKDVPGTEQTYAAEVTLSMTRAFSLDESNCGAAFVG